MNTTLSSSRVRTAILAAFAAGALVLAGFTLSAAADDSDSPGSGGGSRIAMLAQ